MPGADPRRLQYANAVSWTHGAILTATTASGSVAVLPTFSDPLLRYVVTSIQVEVTSTAATDCAVRTQGVERMHILVPLSGASPAVSRVQMSGEGVFLGDPGYSVEFNYPADAARTRLRVYMCAKIVPV